MVRYSYLFLGAALLALGVGAGVARGQTTTKNGGAGQVATGAMTAGEAMEAPGAVAGMGAAVAMAPSGKAEASAMGQSKGMGMGKGKGNWKRYDYQKFSKKDETLPSSTLVIIAYILIWGVMFGYLLYLGARQKTLRVELARLQRKVDKAGSGGGASEPDATA